MTRNYDIDDLEIKTTDRGFLVGVGIIGETPLGLGSGTWTSMLDQFVSLTASRSREVESSLWLHQNAGTLTVTAKYDTTPSLVRGLLLRVTYAGDTLFEGVVVRAERSLQIDTDRPDSQKWAVTVSATDLQDRAARTRVNTDGAPETDVETAIVDRVPYITTVNVNPAAEDGVDLVTLAEGDQEDITVATILQEIETSCSCLVVSDPSDPATVTLAAYSDGDTWELGDTTSPSYRSVRFNESPDLYATGVRLTAPADGGAVFEDRLDTFNRNDKSAALPVIAENLEPIAGTLPLRRDVLEYVSAVDLPWDDQLLPDGLWPVLLDLTLDGTVWATSVLDVTHTITTKSWQVALACGPAHLVTRERSA